MTRRIALACALSFFLHGLLILAGLYRLSYDAYNHMFFADHYLRDWWSLWEPRWYTGFEVTSYPPLVHQLIALLGRLVGVEAAYALILWAVLAAFPAAVYLFSRLFTGERAAGFAAFGAALLPSLFLTAHNFGQLPTLVSGLLALLGAVALGGFLRHGGLLDGGLAVSLFAAAAAGHHATLLFQAGLAGAILFQFLLRSRHSRPRLVFRFGLFLLFAVPAALAVVWPFWEWGSRQALQTPIDHISRHNFIQNPFAAVLFFLPVYGLLIPWLPLELRFGLRKRYLGLGLVFLIMFLLGLGGTTPLPRLFFGPGWTWLTYDRFAFWASLLLLPLLGVGAAWLKWKLPNRGFWFSFLGLMALTGLLIGASPRWLPTQPGPIDMRPIVDWLERGDHGQYRYITLGFGDQLAYLSRLTEATTIDGSYHTARSLPELRQSGIGQIDTAFWLPDGLAALDPILEKAGERGVRWAFLAMKLYKPVLIRNGWSKLAVLPNGVEIWENPAAVPPPPVRPPEVEPFTAFSWGALPLFSFTLAAVLAVRRWWSPAVLVAARAMAIGLLPLGLTFWYYRTVFVIEHPRTYFIYTDALFFLVDGLALFILLTWIAGRLPLPEGGRGAGAVSWPAGRGLAEGVTRSLVPPPAFLRGAGSGLRRPALRLERNFFARPDPWLFALCLLATLSVFWSLDWRTSLYFSLHLWLCFGLFLALRDTPQAWRWFALGCVAALLLQFIAAAGEALTQSTRLVLPLGLHWPGDLDPAVSGVSIVQLADGTRWLRAYGTLPHPNLLGGFLVALLAAPLAYYVLVSRRQALWVLLFNLALVTLVLTFSRSAWLALAVSLAVLLVRWGRAHFHKLALLGATGLATLAMLFAYFQPLFTTRLGAQPVQAEQVSNYTRMWLNRRAVELIQQRPLGGAGVGAFSLALSRHVAEFYDIEPVHNVPLLVVAELGLGGMVLLYGLAVVLASGWGRPGERISRLRSPVAVWQPDARSPAYARSPAPARLPAAVFHAVILGLAAAALFDHYLWTLAPGRMLFAILLGLWAGQVRCEWE